MSNSPLLNPARRPTNAPGIAWSRPVAWITNPDLIAVAVFCAIGLLVAINLILRFPDFAAVV
jgi:hypothetical protein